jgi:hypothetical protein
MSSGGCCRDDCGGGALTGSASPSCPPEYERPHANANVRVFTVKVHWLWVGHTGREGQVPIVGTGRWTESCEAREDIVLFLLF